MQTQLTLDSDKVWEYPCHYRFALCGAFLSLYVVQMSDESLKPRYGLLLNLHLYLAPPEPEPDTATEWLLACARACTCGSLTAR